jgi:hypothetical protein
MMRQIRNVTAAAALAMLTGCASGYAPDIAYADPAYGWDGGYSAHLRHHWHSNQWQDHFDVRDMHRGPHGGHGMAHFGGFHGRFGGGHGVAHVGGFHGGFHGGFGGGHGHR